MPLKAPSRLILLIVTALISAIPRVWVFSRHLPWITADSFTYLNLARVLRGEKVPSGYDPAALAPYDDQGARLPGYPLFLNLAFALNGWKGTDPQVLRKITLERKPTPIELSPYHAKYLTRKENLRAVQFLQHLCGILATVFAFDLLFLWTRSTIFACSGAVLAVGLRPTWILTYERDILTETVAATLVLVFLWVVARMQMTKQKHWLLSASIVGSALALVRPNYAFAVPLLTVFQLMQKDFKERNHFTTVLILSLPYFLLVGGWVTRNGLKYGVWNLTTWTGVVSYHFQSHPEVFEDPILKREINPKDYRTIAHAIGRLMENWNVSFPEANRRLVKETKSAIIRYPEIFLKSFSEAIVVHWLSFIRVSPKWRHLRIAFFLALLVITVAGILATLRKDAPPEFKFSLTFIIVNSLISSLAIDKYDQNRIAFPMESLLTLQAIWLIWKYCKQLTNRCNSLK